MQRIKFWLCSYPKRQCIVVSLTLNHVEKLTKDDAESPESPLLAPHTLYSKQFSSCYYTAFIHIYRDLLFNQISVYNCIKMTEIPPKDGRPALAPLGSATDI